jgi:ankyrin repeat protein
MEVFNLIKNNNFDKIINLIETKQLTNFDIKDNNYNYFIQYIINYNQVNIIKLILELSKTDNINIRLDIFDPDGRSILYNCVKFNYYEMCKLLIDNNKTTIGITIIDIKDRLGYTALHYSIIFNNFEIFKLLLNNYADPYIIAKDGNNAYILCLIYNRSIILDYLLNNIKFINFRTPNGETILQVAINYQFHSIIKNLFNLNINLNNVSNDYGLAVIHQSIILDNFELFKILLDKDINFNLSDFIGNTPLHYIINNNHYNYLELFLNKIKNIQFNLSNINGDIPLHILLDKNIDYKEHINLFNKIIIESDLNLQNNQGITCLMKLVSKNLLDLFHNILIIKPLNFFIEDNNFKHIQITDPILNLLVESYYNQLKINKDDLLIDWEKWCSIDLFEKLKTLINDNENIRGKTSEEICKNKIRNVIVKEKRTLPATSNLNLILDNGIFVNFCYYTGSPIDILFGLILLNNDFKDKGLGIILDYPITINKSLETYYQKLGLDYPYKLDFSNIEIVWCYQKIFFPSYFDDIIKKKIKENKYIVIPIGIITSVGAHANILFIDINNKTIERFEPNGSNFPAGLNYNPVLLDSLLENKFKQIDKNIIYYPPFNFLPNVSFQKIESLEITRCKIGDPNGFCGVWCIWWVYQRMVNINNNKLTLKNLAENLIKYIKFDNISFKSVIRNFSKKITEIRDSYFKKYSIDINDWIVGNYSEEILNKLEKDIFKIL